jgi:hypothetical protein
MKQVKKQHEFLARQKIQPIIYQLESSWTLHQI